MYANDIAVHFNCTNSSPVNSLNSVINVWCATNTFSLNSVGIQSLEFRLRCDIANYYNLKLFGVFYSLILSSILILSLLLKVYLMLCFIFE